MIHTFLAVTEPLKDSPEMNYITTGAIAAVCSMVSGLVLYGKGKQARTVSINDQPVGVAVQKDFVTREECRACKLDSRVEVQEMKALYDKCLTLIDTRDQRLTDKITALTESVTQRFEAGAIDAGNRRRDIHEKINRADDRIGRMETNVDVSKHIGKLGGAIMAAIKKSTANS